MINLEAKNTYHVFDEFGMLVIPSDQSWEKRSWWKKLWDKILKREWIPTWSNKSWMDSLGRIILAGLAYGFTREIIKAIESCYRNGILYRHPDHDEVASRDHHSYFYIYRKFTGQPLPDFPSMRGMNLWMKSLMDNKRAEWFYYAIYIPGAYLGNGWLKFCRRWMNFGGCGLLTTWNQDEATNEWWIREFQTWESGYCETITNGLNLQRNRTKWQNLWGRIIGTTIPAYALHNKAWQIYVMPESKKRGLQCKVLLKRVGKSNLMLRLLFGDTTVTQEEVDNYPHMTGFRPGAYLNTTSRDIRELTEEEAEFNTYEKDLIIWLFNQKQNG